MKIFQITAMVLGVLFVLGGTQEAKTASIQQENFILAKKKGGHGGHRAHSGHRHGGHYGGHRHWRGGCGYWIGGGALIGAPLLYYYSSPYSSRPYCVDEWGYRVPCSSYYYYNY